MPSSTKIVFLLGSGVSIPAGMPSTQDITEAILSGGRIKQHSDERDISRIVDFLNRIKIEIDAYYKRQTYKNVNYEDFYYLVNQIYDSEYREYDNPGIQPFIDKIEPDIKPFLKNLELKELASKTERYIENFIVRLLSRQPEKNGLSKFVK